MHEIVEDGPPPPAPRLAAGTRSEIGRINDLLARIAGRAVGTEPLQLFTTLARSRRLFRGWLRFAGALTLHGVLPRADAELVILRVGTRCACVYELAHHTRIAPHSGLTADQIDAIVDPGVAGTWSPRQRALLRAVDELHDSRNLSDEAWHDLSAQISDAEILELCLLAGHYEMLAMTLNALRIPPDRVRGPVAIRRLLRRRARAGQ